MEPTVENLFYMLQDILEQPGTISEYSATGLVVRDSKGRAYVVNLVRSEEDDSDI